MSVLEIILGALLIIASIVMIIVIILQEGNQQGVGVISGGADTFFSKNKARSYDAFLARATKWFAIGFVAVVLALNVYAYFSAKAVAEDAAADAAVSDTLDAESEVADADSQAAEDADSEVADADGAAETAAEGDTAAATEAAETSESADT